MHRIITGLILLLLMSNLDNAQAQLKDKDSILYRPIGKFHTSFNTGTGAPRQGILMPQTEGSIEIFPDYHDALKDLNLFEYIIVLYHFSEVETWEPTVNPPASAEEHDFGLFATRSPKRPNPIGFSIVKLKGIVDGKLLVSGVDAFDGTPVLDIKPYLPSIDCIRSTQNEMVEKELGHHDEDFISDPTFFK